MSYKLNYFSIRGRGEQVRLFLNALELPFEDVLIKPDQFKALKKQGPSTLSFGSLPMLEDGDFRLCQGPVILSYLARQQGAAPNDSQLSAQADAIAWGAEDLRMRYFKLLGDDAEKAQAEFIAGNWKTRWLPSLNGLLDLNGNSHHFIGDQLTHADIAMWDVLNAILEGVQSASLDGHNAVQAFYDSIRNRPAVAAYLESRSK